MTAEEYNAIVHEFKNRICRFAEKLLHSKEVALDVTQDAFMKLWENRNGIDKTKIKSWLFTTVYHQCLQLLKKERRFVSGASLDQRSFQMPQPDLKKVLQDSLDLLNEQQRSIILLRDYEGYNYDEIGQILDLNESQVKVYLFRARKRIKEYIKDLEFVI